MTRGRNLKCPRCKGHTAWKAFDRQGDTIAIYKACNCGYEGRKRYIKAPTDKACERCNAPSSFAVCTACRTDLYSADEEQAKAVPA